MEIIYNLMEINNGRWLFAIMSEVRGSIAKFFGNRKFHLELFSFLGLLLWVGFSLWIIYVKDKLL